MTDRLFLLQSWSLCARASSQRFKWCDILRAHAGTRIAMVNNEPGVGRAKAPFNRKRVQSVSENFHGDLYKIPIRFEPASSRIPMPSVTAIAVKNVRNSGLS
jgi:hypothetical protein